MFTMSEDQIKVIIVISEAVISIICLVLVVFFQKRFYDMSHYIQIQKRYSDILKYMGVFITAWFIYGFPLMSLDFANIKHSESTKEAITRANYAAAIPLTCGIFMTTTWRFWHIYYDLKYASSQKNSEWKYHLDPELADHNFWLLHKKTYGSAKWTKKVAMMWYIVTVSIIIAAYEITLTTNYFWVAHTVSFIGHSVATTAMLALAFKVPRYNDNFFVRNEMNTIVIQLGIVTVFTFVVCITGIFLSHAMIVLSFCGSILFLDMFLVSFWWIPKKILVHEIQLNVFKAARKRLNEDSVASNTILSSKQNQKRSDKNSNLNHHIGRLSGLKNHLKKKPGHTLHDILCYDKTFKMFMQHLAKEFSMECLLCFVEIMQYKFLLVERFDIVNEDAITSDTKFADQYPLYNVVPLSSINRHAFTQDLSFYSRYDSKDIINEAKNVCLELYRKYMEEASELEVNISYETRCRLKNLLGDEQFFIGFNIVPDELYCMFDDTATTMFRLMHASFSRFMYLPIFNNVKQALNNRNAHLSLT
eukprot:396696_1